MDRAIGIDLGTTYTCAAVVERGKPQVIRSKLGHLTIPSIVAFDKNGQEVVGHRAERNMILEPEHTIYGSKRLLGRTFLPGVLERFQPHFRYKLVGDDEGFVAGEVHGRIVTFTDVAAHILREMARAAAEGLGQPIKRAVVTVPAYFNENQRSVVREAGQRADLDIIRIINEPTAAALSFGYGREEHQHLLVFDLGGGTFDVSIVKLDGNVFTVLATKGDTFLGGLDFDQRLMDSIIERVTTGKKKLDPVSWQRLRLAAQDAKHELSVQAKTTISLPNVSFTDGSSVDIVEVITREQFEERTQDLLDGTDKVVGQALAAAGLYPSDIDEVLLVGGQTRMPAVQRRIKELFNKEPSKRVHPDEVVAMGAAICADSFDRFDAAVLMDVMPMPIIIAEPGGRTQKVIGRNTPVPHDATAVVDIPPNATSLKLAVFQGERARMDDNEYLGSLIIDEIPESDESRSCQIRMQLDAECLLTIHASIEGTQIDRELKLATQQTPDDVLGEIGAERIRTVRRSARSDAQNPADAKGKKPKAPGPGWFARLFGWLRR